MEQVIFWVRAGAGLGVRGDVVQDFVVAEFGQLGDVLEVLACAHCDGDFHTVNAGFVDELAFTLWEGFLLARLTHLEPSWKVRSGKRNAGTSRKRSGCGTLTYISDSPVELRLQEGDNILRIHTCQYGDPS